MSQIVKTSAVKRRQNNRSVNENLKKGTSPMNKVGEKGLDTNKTVNYVVNIRACCLPENRRDNLVEGKVLEKE